MAISRELFSAILAMDSYNRGYDAGISGLSDTPNTQIGNAHVIVANGDPVAQSAGFYAIAYDMTGATNFAVGEKVVSYRGTDNILRASALRAEHLRVTVIT
jgi:hypothetical protein